MDDCDVINVGTSGTPGTGGAATRGAAFSNTTQRLTATLQIMVLGTMAAWTTVDTYHIQRFEYVINIILEKQTATNSKKTRILFISGPPHN